MLETELILRPADAILDRQILNRLHIQRDAGDVGERRLQAADHRLASMRRSSRGLRLI